jgi:hypothetical protein
MAPALSRLELQEPCFLCDPNHAWVYETSDHFIAMLGLGPIGEGYSLIAARDHVPSMLDLPAAQAEELAEFTVAVRGRLEPVYGAAVVTEHGRIAPCLTVYSQTFEPHCLHAHRLVFPGHNRVELGASYPSLETCAFDSFLSSRRDFAHEGQYLYAEDADGTCEIAPVSGPIPRQFFRRLIAARVGSPELADWNAHPQLDVVAAGERRLK